MKDKFILDATAGFRMMWFNKNHPNTIYLDHRAECEPDIVGDFRDLKQFANESFRLIVFDPPHLLRSNQWKNEANMLLNFGHLIPETWQSDLKKGFKECWRVLKPYGVLIFKWSNYDISSDNVLALISEKPLFYQISSSSGKNKTLWFCFMKIPNKD